MALGWCMECAQLKPIQTVGQKWGSRECEWAPVPHDVETHVACGSLVTWIEAKTAKGNTYWQPVCAKCGPLDAGLSGLMVSKPCPGSLRPIR